MKAVVYNEYGSLDVLTLEEVPKPTPGEGEVLIKIHAASVNFGDRALVEGSPFIARFWSGLLKPKHPILGTDIAGRVEAVGGNVTKLQPGDAVFGDMEPRGFGAFAEYVVVPENLVTRMPPNVTFEEVAAVPQAGVVALQGLRNYGEIQPGDHVLVNGASGGVGTFAVQIARALGAEVTGVCGTRNLDMLRSIGADHVIDYTQEDFTRNGERYDLIFDIVANRSVSDYLSALMPGGRYVACAFNPTSLFFGPLISRREGKKVSSLVHKPNVEDLVFMGELLEAGKVRPVIDRCYSLGEVADAIGYLADEQHRGKVVITMEHSVN